jgi:hypothetical protein
VEALAGLGPLMESDEKKCPAWTAGALI